MAFLKDFIWQVLIKHQNLLRFAKVSQLYTFSHQKGKGSVSSPFSNHVPILSKTPLTVSIGLLVSSCLFSSKANITYFLVLGSTALHPHIEISSVCCYYTTNYLKVLQYKTGILLRAQLLWASDSNRAKQDGWSLLSHVGAFNWEDSVVGRDLTAGGWNRLEAGLVSCLLCDAGCWLRPSLELCIGKDSLEKLNQLGSHWKGESTLLSPPSQGLMSSRNTLKDIPRNKVHRGPLQLLELTHQTNHKPVHAVCPGGLGLIAVAAEDYQTSDMVAESSK